MHHGKIAYIIGVNCYLFIHVYLSTQKFYIIQERERDMHISL